MRVGTKTAVIVVSNPSEDEIDCRPAARETMFLPYVLVEISTICFNQTFVSVLC